MSGYRFPWCLVCFALVEDESLSQMCQSCRDRIRAIVAEGSASAADADTAPAPDDDASGTPTPGIGSSTKSD
jgi:hypothetical protein